MTTTWHRVVVTLGQPVFHCRWEMRRRWTLVWAGLHMIGQVTGGWSAVAWPASPTDTSPPTRVGTMRVLNLAPLALPFLTSAWSDRTLWGLVAGAGFWAGRHEALRRHQRPAAVATKPWLPSRRPVWCTGAVVRATAWPRNHQQGWTVAAVIVTLGTERGGQTELQPAIGDGILLRGEGPPPALWELLAGVVEGHPAAAASVWGGYDAARYLAGHGLTWEGRWQPAPEIRGSGRDPLQWLGCEVLLPVRQGLLQRLREGLPPREAELTAAVLLGQRDTSSRTLREVFARLGLAHLFAVSGLHVGIILAMVAKGLAWVNPSPRLRCHLFLLILPPYAVLTGMSASVVRAASLAGLYSLAPLAGRRLDSLHVLGLLFWLNCVWQPRCVLDTGLRLSFLAAIGIITVTRILSPWLRRQAVSHRWLFTGLLVTLAAQLFTLPEIAQSFGWFHLLSPGANLLAVPVFTVAVWLVVLGLLIWPLAAPLGKACLALSWPLWRLLEAGTAWVTTHLPGELGMPPLGPWRLLGLIGLAALMLWRLACLVRNPRGGRCDLWKNWLPLFLIACLLPVLLTTGRTCRPGLMTAVQFDVGQGDCALLVFPDGWRILIDSGPAWAGGSAWERGVKPWLRREGIRQLDAVALTHGHLDHSGGAKAIAASMDVDHWWLGGRASAPDSRVPFGSSLRHEIVHRAGLWSLICQTPLSITDVAAEIGENNRSLQLGLHHGASLVALWSGDLEEPAELCWMQEEPLPPLSPDLVWKAGHHGSHTSGCQPFLAGLRPHIVLISCGIENRHGHPSHGAFCVGTDTARILRTDLHGSVLLQWSPDAVLSRVQTVHPNDLVWTGRGRSGVHQESMSIPAGSARQSICE